MSTERRKCLVTLGLSEGATEDDIKKAYRKMALLYHPDKNGSEDAKGKFQEIGYAYKYLTEGPSAFETTNPHDVREELLRRMFEEMFFAQFHGPFAFFCEDSDEDDYYIYHDSSDDDYNASYGTHDAYGHTRTFQNTYASQTPLHQNYPQVSKKQIRKREKRQRQKERAKERKEQGRKEKREAKNVYTDDINSEQKQREQKTEPAARDNHDKQSAGKTDSGNSRPDTPVTDQQPQKSNKKQKKKIESEQRKREKEMEEIAVELKKKHVREMEKQKEKERLAAQKREEGKENEINFSHFFDTGKKTRKARQREKKRQESGIGATQRDNSGSSVQSEKPDKPLHQVNTNTNSTSSKKAKEKTGVSINKTQERNRMPTKSAKPGNRFVILDEIDDIIRPLSRTSISSNDSMNDSHKNEDGFHEGRYSSRSQTNGTVKSFSFRNTNMNQNNSNSNLCTDFSNTETIRERDMKGNEGFARQGNRINQNGKNVQDNFKGRNEPQPFSRSSSYDPGGFNVFEGEKERQFVQDWSVGVDDDEDDTGDNWSNYGQSQFTNDQTGARFGYGTNPVPDKFGNGYNGWNEARGGSHQPRGHQKKKEFVPRTRGNHGRPDSGSYFHGPQNFVPPYGRGYAPFTRGGEGMFHHQPPHFRGGYHGMPPFRGRNGGYSGPRYGPPVGMPDNYYRHPFDSPMHNSFFNGREGNFKSDMNRNTNWRGNNRKQFNPNKSFNSNFTQKLDSTKKECNQNDLPSNTVKSNNTPSASGSRESSPQFMSWQNIKDSDKNGQFTENMFSNLGNNQASSSGSLDSLDDIVNYEANRVSDNQNVMNGTSAASASRSFLDSGVDMGMSEFLSKDSLGVPSGMFTDNIKNYYR